MHKRVKNA